MLHAADEAQQRDTNAGGQNDLHVSRRHFLRLGTAWAVGFASFVAAEDEGGEDN